MFNNRNDRIKRVGMIGMHVSEYSIVGIEYLIVGMTGLGGSEYLIIQMIGLGNRN